MKRFGHKQVFIFACSLMSLIFSHSSLADVGIDIRTTISFNSVNEDISYIASIEDCSSLAMIEAGTVSEKKAYTNELTQLNPDKPNSCSIQFNVNGADRFNPLVSITFNDNSIQIHQESFQYDAVRPVISFNTVAIEGDEEQQYLVTSLNANDDTDIAYIGFNVTGLRASDIRSAGGVIAQARKKAFALTGDTIRVYPDTDQQTLFTHHLALNQLLTSEAIAYDAVVLIDAFVVDASGNQSAISKIAFTGDNIQEEIEDLIVSNTRLIISNPLETPVIKPSVKFQFRGIVPMDGSGTGIHYESSHPDLIGVTNSGLVYALQETGSAMVTITISYEGLDQQHDIKIPVQADFNKEIVALQLKGIDNNTPFELPALNTYYPLPELQGVFDDGSSAVISDHWRPKVSVNENMASILQLNKLGELQSTAVISKTTPARILIQLLELPGIKSEILIIAKDREPEITLKLSASTQVGSDLILKAQVSDDVGINRVKFMLNGAAIGTRDTPPYELIIPISKEMEGRNLIFSGIAIDTIGQTASTIDYPVQVKAKPSPVAPEFSFESPADALRSIEKSPVIFQVSSLLGEMPDVAKSHSGIYYVEFYIAGEKVGQSKYPTVEVREKTNPDGSITKELYELWKFNSSLPSIATTETSISASAKIYASNGAIVDAPDHLIRLLENSQPIIRIVKPLKGSIATVGQNITISLEASDDALYSGSSIQLYVNDTLIEHREFTDKKAQINSFDTQTVTETFNYHVNEEETGSTLQIRAKIVDYHQSLNYSEILRIPVKGDQLPTAAISHPVEGASFVAGLPIQLRADAADDLGLPITHKFQLDF